MGALICLQGGAELTPACVPMDRHVLELAPEGPLAVVPLACATRAERRAVGRDGREHYASLGVPDVRVAPGPHLSVGATVRMIVQAGTVIVPGGSAVRARAVVMGTAVGAALRAHVARGGAIIASAEAAMALAAWMVVPGRARNDRIRSGLGLVPGLLVLPNFGGDTVVPLQARVRRLKGWMAMVGIPEHSGIVYHDQRLSAVGAHDSWVSTEDRSWIRLVSGSRVGHATSAALA